MKQKIIILSVILVMVGIFITTKKYNYQQFLNFKKSETQIAQMDTINKIELKLLLDKTLVLKVDGEKEKYSINLVNINKEQLDHLARINFKDSKVMYFTFQHKKCLVGIFKNSKMMIQGDTKSDQMKPFSFFERYQFYCDVI